MGNSVKKEKMKDTLALIADVAESLEAEMKRNHAPSNQIQDVANIRNIARDECQREAVTDCNHPNAAKMRDALIRVLDWLKRMNAQPLNTLAVSELTPSYAVNRTAKSIIEDNDYHISQLTAALSAPPRNCDVGTGEEQTLRFHDFCESHRVPFDHSRGTMCVGAKCPAYNDDANCFFKWAQLPYEAEGGAV